MKPFNQNHQSDYLILTSSHGQGRKISIVLRRIFLMLLFIPVMLLSQSCSDDNDDVMDDGQPPVIDFAHGRESFRPDQGEVRSSTTNHIHLRYSVSDNAGIEEIRASVTSSYPGNMPDGFALIDVEHLFSPDAEEEAFRIDEGSTFVNVDATASDIYWENIMDELPIAGPYDFRVTATDIFGNQTHGEQEVHKAFYLSRAYAPLISLDHEEHYITATAGETVDLQGHIMKNEEEDMAADLAFVWIRIVAEDAHDDFDPVSDILFEASWGQSLRLNTSGDDIPGTADISIMDDLLTEDNEMTAPEEAGTYSVIIWAEDATGNVSRVSAELLVTE